MYDYNINIKSIVSIKSTKCQRIKYNINQPLTLVLC